MTKTQRAICKDASTIGTPVRHELCHVLKGFYIGLGLLGKF
jgi:hypothetical protein